MRIYTTDPKKGFQVFCGDYNEETKTFVRHVKPEHFVRVGQGWALQESALFQLKSMGCEKVVIVDMQPDGRHYFESELWHWFGERSFVKDLGHGLQRVLPKKLMNGHYGEGPVRKKPTMFEFLAILDNDQPLQFFVKAKDMDHARDVATHEALPKLMIKKLTTLDGDILFERKGGR